MNRNHAGRRRSAPGRATEFTLPYGPIFAGSVVAIVIIVLIFKRNVISGLTAGAIK